MALLLSCFTACRQGLALVAFGEPDEIGYESPWARLLPSGHLQRAGRLRSTSVRRQFAEDERESGREGAVSRHLPDSLRAQACAKDAPDANNFDRASAIGAPFGEYPSKQQRDDAGPVAPDQLDGRQQVSLVIRGTANSGFSSARPTRPLEVQLARSAPLPDIVAYGGVKTFQPDVIDRAVFVLIST